MRMNSFMYRTDSNMLKKIYTIPLKSIDHLGCYSHFIAITNKSYLAKRKNLKKNSKNNQKQSNF